MDQSSKFSLCFPKSAFQPHKIKTVRAPSQTASLIKGYLVSGNVGWQHLTCPGSWRLPLMKVETRKQDEVKLGVGRGANVSH